MSDNEAATLEAELGHEEAARDIADAVSARHSIARKYVLHLRRRNPDATPGEVVRMLERQYTTAITTAGTALAVGEFAASLAIGLIPAGGAAKAVGQQAAKTAAKQAAKAVAKEAAKAAAKGMALNAAKGGAKQIVGLLPAGEQQLQFEITAIFGLALADIHGIDYDKDQAQALVFGLTNERVSQKQIAKMATDVANASTEEVVDVPAGTNDGQWATTLADALPGGAAQSFVRTMQTGQLDSVRHSLNKQQQAAIDYGVKAVAGGMTRFVFGREVVAAARIAFPDAPDEFPAGLLVPFDEDDESEAEPNRAIAALEDAARASGTWVVGAAGAVGGGIATGAAAAGTGVATVAGTATRPFRSVDLDGDGIPDEARALTAVKEAGGAVADLAGAVSGHLSGLFKHGSHGKHEADDLPDDGEHVSA